MLEEELIQRLEQAFVTQGGQGAVVIKPLLGCGDSFSVEVVSELFEGAKRLQRHKMVNEAVGDLMDGIHALSITAKTPAENTASEQQ